MFVTQLCFASICYVVVFLISPYFAKLFDTTDKDLLVSIIRVSALTMPLGALAGVQNSVVTRRMQFRWFFYTSLVSLAISAIVGLYMAYSGYGAWALVGQSMSSMITSTFVLFILLDWHPHFRFHYERFKPLFLTGLKFMGTSLMGTFFGQLKGYALGMKYSGADLAYYNRGEGLPNLACNNIDNTIQSVLFPALSQIQDDPDAVRNALRRAIRISTFILMPLLFGLAAIADKLIIIIFTEKWAPSIPYMQVLSICLAIGIMCNVNLQALKARGQIGLILKLEFIKKPIMLLVILGTMMVSPLAIAWGMLYFNIFVYFVNSYPNKKNIGYSYIDQLKDIIPNLLQAAIMAVFVYFLGLLPSNIYFVLCVQVIFGIVLYFLMSIIFKNESFLYVLNTIRERRNKR